MKSLKTTFVAAVLAGSFVAPALAESWDVSLWGKRRAFTEHVEKFNHISRTQITYQLFVLSKYVAVRGSC